MMKMFVPSQHRQYFADILSNAIVKSDLQIHTIKNGYVAIDRGRETYCVLDADKNIVQPSQYVRGNKIHRIAPKAKCVKNCPVYDQSVIYCDGGRMFHFGHCLIEGLSRVWACTDKKYSDIKLVFAENELTALPKYAMEFLRLLGVPQSNVIVLNKSARFKTIYVPTPSFDISGYSSVEWVSMCRHMAASVTADKIYEKIYLSRTAMGRRKTFGEEQIEYIFQQNGYKVICPEQLPLKQQIALMKNCKILVGLAGTALHMAGFMPASGTVIQLKRNTLPGDNLKTQYLINQAAELDTVLVWASTEPEASPHFSSKPQLVGMTPELKQFCDEMEFTFDTAVADKLAHTGRAEYDVAMKAWRHTQKVNKYKKFLIKLLGLFIPVRRVRHNAHNYLKKKINCTD